MASSLYVDPEGRHTPNASDFDMADRSRAVPRHRLSDLERAQVYEDLQPLVRRLIRQFGETQEMRQELEGEIYYRFCQLLEEYEPDRGIALYAYLIRKLYTSTYAHARTQWRQRAQRERHEVSWEEREEAGVQVGAPWADPVEGWISETEQSETLAKLGIAIEGLTERQRQVVVWRYYEGKSFEEIAALQGNKPATVRSLLRHALNSLRSRMVPISEYPEDEV